MSTCFLFLKVSYELFLSSLNLPQLLLVMVTQRHDHRLPFLCLAWHICLIILLCNEKQKYDHIDDKLFRYKIMQHSIVLPSSFITAVMVCLVHQPLQIHFPLVSCDICVHVLACFEMYAYSSTKGEGKCRLGNIALQHCHSHFPLWFSRLLVEATHFLYDWKSQVKEMVLLFYNMQVQHLVRVHLLISLLRIPYSEWVKTGTSITL